MLRQVLTGFVFLGSLQFAPSSLAETLIETLDIATLPSTRCKSKSAEQERDCLTKRINVINGLLGTARYTPGEDKAIFGTAGREAATKVLEAELAEATAANTEIEKEKNFVGFNWGVGLAFTSLAGQKAIKDAKLIGGVVRVTEDYSHSAGLMLETHYYFKKRMTTANQELGIGPFVAIRVADTEKENWEISAYGIGLMLGGRRDSAPKGFNLGIGYFVDTKVKRLGGGIVEGQPLPAGETEIRYRNTDASGWMAILTATF